MQPGDVIPVSVPELPDGIVIRGAIRADAAPLVPVIRIADPDNPDGSWRALGSVIDQSLDPEKPTYARVVEETSSGALVGGMLAHGLTSDTPARAGVSDVSPFTRWREGSADPALSASPRGAGPQQPCRAAAPVGLPWPGGQAADLGSIFQRMLVGALVPVKCLRVTYTSGWG